MGGWKIKYIDDYLAMENGFSGSISEDENNAIREKFIARWSRCIPDKLYHYMPFSQKYHIKSLIDSKLWFSFPCYFNDLNDSRVIMDINEDIIEVSYEDRLTYFSNVLDAIEKKISNNERERNKLSEEILGEKCDIETSIRNYCLEKFLGSQYTVRDLIKVAIYKLKNQKDAVNISDIYNKYKILIVKSYIEASDKEVAICSFSKKNDDMLMWTHYADQHRGICLEYDTKEVQEKLGFIFPVVYNHPAYYTDLCGCKNSIESFWKRDYHLKRYLFKSKEWKYEKEWRALLDTKENCKYFNAETRGFLSPELKPVKIYFGANMSGSDKEFINTIVGNMKKDIECCQMKICEDNWKFEEI